MFSFQPSIFDSFLFSFYTFLIISHLYFTCQGVIKAMEAIFPESRRRICAVQFYKNVFVDYQVMFTSISSCKVP